MPKDIKKPETMETAPPGTAVLFLRIPLSWDVAIETIAQSEVRTKASIGKQAIKEYLERRGHIER